MKAVPITIPSNGDEPAHRYLQITMSNGHVYMLAEGDEPGTLVISANSHLAADLVEENSAEISQHSK